MDSIYPYDEETMELLDTILKELRNKERGSRLGLQSVAKLFNIEIKNNRSAENIFENAHKILSDLGMIKDLKHDMKFFIINSEGVHFIDQGGFKADKERFEQQLILEQEDRELLRELRKLNVEDLTKRLAGMEKMVKERSAFWTTTATKNKRYLILSLLALGLNVFALIINIYLNTTST